MIGKDKGVYGRFNVLNLYLINDYYLVYRLVLCIF